MAPAAEALKHQFSYLVNSIDTDALLPAALSRNLITDHQRKKCYNETDPYKKAKTFLGHLQRAVNGGDSIKYDTLIHILQETGQVQIASCLRDEFTRSIRSMQQRLAPSSTHEGELVEVPNELVEELLILRSAFVKLLCNYGEQLSKFLSRLFRRAVEYHSFQSHFNTLIEEEVSLFNIFYLKQLSSTFPKDIRAMTTQLVDEYEQKLKHFMGSATVSQFKQLYPATATFSKLSSGKVSITLILEHYWDKDTLDDLTKFVTLLGVSGSHLHLSKVEDGCIAVTWLCSTSEVKQLKTAILEATSSLQTMGLLQVLIGGEELVLECSVTERPARVSLPTVSSPTHRINAKRSADHEFVRNDFPGWEQLLLWLSLALLAVCLPAAIYDIARGEVVCQSILFPHSSKVMNKHCQQSLSHRSYYKYLLFVILQSIVQLLPLWYFYSKWHISCFFNALKIQQPFTAEGECEQEAFEAISKLDEQFSKTKGLKRVYFIKMVLDLIIWGMSSAILLMFYRQDTLFQCHVKSVLPKEYCSLPRNCENFDDSLFIYCHYSWLQYVWTAHCFILVVYLASIVYSFIWFYLKPIKTSKNMNAFCLDSHLSPAHFTDTTSIARASVFDFLIELHRPANSDFAAILNVAVSFLQIKKAVVFRLMKCVKHSNDDKDSKFQSAHTGVLESTEMPPLPSVHKLIYQCLNCVNPPDKEKQCCLDITFGTTVYGVALGRKFAQAVSVSFLSQLSGSSVTPANTHVGLSHSRVTLPDTIYDQKNNEIEQSDTAINDLLWKSLNTEERQDLENKTVLNFVLVGPIQDKQNIINANVLLSKLYHFCCFNRNCHMLTLRPIKIGYKDVTSTFYKFAPLEHMFEMDKKKMTSGLTAIQCGTLQCLFGVKLYHFKGYGIRHPLYRHPIPLEGD